MNLIEELKKVHKEIKNLNGKNIEVIELEDTGYEIGAYAYKWTNDCSLEHTVVIGCSHGNEPVGAWFCIFLLKQIVINNLSFTNNINKTNFIIIPILDYEVAIKNKQWLQHNFNYINFFSHNYLNPTFEQLEFSYSTENRITSNNVIVKLQDLLSNIKIKIILSCHQTPSIYGGYYFTNINNANVLSKLQYSFIKNNIPLEIVPQGKGVEVFAKGVFGQFNINNLGEFHEVFLRYDCSQTYFGDKLRVPFLVIEVPFGYSPFLYSKICIDTSEFTNKIKDIMEKNKELLYLLDKKYDLLSLKLSQRKEIYKQVNGYYWLKSYKNSDVYINEKIESKIMLQHEFLNINRLLFFKAQFVGMLLRTEEYVICNKAQEIMNSIIQILEQTLKILNNKWINLKLGTQLIYNCLNILIHNRDDLI